MSRATQMRLTVELAEREPFDVDVRLMDHHGWDVACGKNKWPGPSEGPMTWLGYLAFLASRRTGKIDPAMTWDQFLTACDGVTNLDEDDEDGPGTPGGGDLGPTL